MSLMSRYKNNGMQKTIMNCFVMISKTLRTDSKVVRFGFLLVMRKISEHKYNPDASGLKVIIQLPNMEKNVEVFNRTQINRITL